MIQAEGYNHLHIRPQFSAIRVNEIVTRSRSGSQGPAGEPVGFFFGCIARKWLGWQDSNLRMAASKAAALPLGDTPTTAVLVQPPDSDRPIIQFVREGQGQLSANS